MAIGAVRQDTMAYCCGPKVASDTHHLLPSHPFRLTSFLSGPSAGLGFLLVGMTHTFAHERSQPWCPTRAIVAVTAHLWTQKHQELPCESPVTRAFVKHFLCLLGDMSLS